MGFADRVYAATKKIPRGKVSTYGEIARALRTKGYRAVGQALHVNPYAPFVPCHRVISSSGKIGGFASGVKKKIRLLHEEGVKVKRNHINLQAYFFALKKRKGHKVPLNTKIKT